MTPAELLKERACTAQCLLASTPATRCRCPGCNGSLHGALAHAHIDALLDGRRRGLHRLPDSDLEILAS